MHHSKYNPKYDPKNAAYEPKPSVPGAQATAPAVSIPSAQTVMATQTKTSSHDEVSA